MNIGRPSYIMSDESSKKNIQAMSTNASSNIRTTPTRLSAPSMDKSSFSTKKPTNAYYGL